MQQNLPRITPSSPPKSCASIPVRPKVKSSDQIANAPKKRRRRRKKIRNTNPAASRQPEHLATDRHLQHGTPHPRARPRSLARAWPLPAGSAPRTVRAVQTAVAGLTRVLGRKKCSELGGQSWLVAYWPPARHRPANRGLVWGVGGWLAGWLDVSVRDRAWQSFGRSVGLSRWVMDGGSQPGRGLESEGWGWLECRRQGAGGFVESTCMVGWLIDDG